MADQNGTQGETPQSILVALQKQWAESGEEDKGISGIEETSLGDPVPTEEQKISARRTVKAITTFLLAFGVVLVIGGTAFFFYRFSYLQGEIDALESKVSTLEQNINNLVGQPDSVE